MDGVTVFHEVYGPMPEATLALFKRVNVTSSDWDAMLGRWGMKWGEVDRDDWAPIHNFVVTHSERGYYSYPMYG